MLILLDIDGVMLPANPWKKPDFLEDNFFAFHQRSVKAFRKLTENIRQVDIVLTTSHKSSFPIEEWKNIFIRREITFESIDRLPDNVHHHSRIEEIMKWLENNKIENEDFIIIDDDKSLNGLPKHLKKRLIQPSPTVGLTEYLIDEMKHLFQ